jgi:ligand-binding SRPBCC domain-containing protein
MSKLYSFQTIQRIPAPADEVWDFISSPANLKIITPASMGFEVTTDTPSDKMYAGLIIAYKVSPLLGIKMDWVTEITHVKEGAYFVDEQRFGPYALWHHKHFIKPIDKGVEMTDIVHYKIPFGVLGDLANAVIVRNKLKEIFDYRFKKMEELFGKY